MQYYHDIKAKLMACPKTWLITGVAGFIGSNLLEELLLLGQYVVGIDNFSTGHWHNLESVEAKVGSAIWKNFTFFEGDICNFEYCQRAVAGVDYVLHQAALGSVPRSIGNPLPTNASNITGFLNILTAAQQGQVNSFTYAASSSTYGDSKLLPKVEDIIGNPLSPYAVTKYVNELYAGVFARCYNFRATGLRYFNVFGRRQDPNGSYAAVIPKWISSMLNDEDVFINGDGTTSRDFCYIDNVIQMNILAATASEDCRGDVYNVAVGGRASLNELYSEIQSGLQKRNVTYSKDPIYRDFRAGDVRHSQASIEKARLNLNYSPTHNLSQGMTETIEWYLFNELSR